MTTIFHLIRALESAESALARAPYINDTQRSIMVEEQARRDVDRLRRQIATVDLFALPPLKEI